MNDVCLLLEGTYPYVAGGVSTWVYQLINEMHDTSFSIVYLGSHRFATKRMHYDIPENVNEFREFYIFDYQVRSERNIPWRSRKKGFKVLEEFLLRMRRGDPSFFDELIAVLGDERKRIIDLYDIVYSFDSWKVLERLYAHEAGEISFIDYFWTWRFIYLPFLILLTVDLPEARLYHSVSTGYAGILGVLAKHRYNRPFLLTEHGIYTRERKIEISQADWIYSKAAQELKVTEGKDFFKEWWTNLFSFFSRLAYDRADEIVTLFEDNRRTQINEGADPAKIRMISNAVEISKFANLKRDHAKGVFRIGFMGRVVPIKDVKTFIRACRIIRDELKNVEIYIMGPTDEDEEYYRECTLLVEMESLQDVVRFMGKIDVRDYYPKLDVIVLTSISEGQPIVILEAGACGIPVVATDVGSCSDLLNGSRPDDKLLGPSGIITPICNPEATAEAVIRILRDQNLYKQMSDTGRKRVSTYYQMDELIANYQALYYRYMKEIRWVI